MENENDPKLTITLLKMIDEIIVARDDETGELNENTLLSSLFGDDWHEKTK